MGPTVGDFLEKNHLDLLRNRDSFTLPKTSIAPTNGWLEYYFPIGFRPIFRGEPLVSGRVYVFFIDLESTNNVDSS